MNDNLNIYINTICDITKYPNNSVYKLLELGDTRLKEKYPIDVVKDNTDLSKLNQSICEFTGIYSVYKNEELKDYIGFCQYRKFFSFFDKVPNVEEIFNEHDIIVAKPLTLKCNLLQQYILCHNVKDLNRIMKICTEMYPEYQNDCVDVLLNKTIYPCNMFIMKKDDFIKYCDFVYNILKVYLKEENISIYNDCINKVKKNTKYYLKNFYPNNTEDYQSRFIAYLIERLTNIFIYHNFKKPYQIDIVETEQKYGKNIFNPMK